MMASTPRYPTRATLGCCQLQLKLIRNARECLVEDFCCLNFSPFLSRKVNLHIGVYLNQPTIEITREELIFSGTDLIASVGGYLGLCLGASFMSMYQSLYSLAMKAVSKKLK